MFGGLAQSRHDRIVTRPRMFRFFTMRQRDASRQSLMWWLVHVCVRVKAVEAINLATMDLAPKHPPHGCERVYFTQRRTAFRGLSCKSCGGVRVRVWRQIIKSELKVLQKIVCALMFLIADKSYLRCSSALTRHAHSRSGNVTEGGAAAPKTAQVPPSLLQP